MTYTHLTPNELVMIDAYFNTCQPVSVVSKTLNRSRQTIYNYLKSGKSIKTIKIAVEDVPLFYQKPNKHTSKKWSLVGGHLK